MASKSDFFFLFSPPLYQPPPPCQTHLFVQRQTKSSKSSKQSSKEGKDCPNILLVFFLSPPLAQLTETVQALVWSSEAVTEFHTGSGWQSCPSGRARVWAGLQSGVRSCNCWASCVNTCPVCMQGEWCCTPSSVCAPCLLFGVGFRVGPKQVYSGWFGK